MELGKYAALEVKRFSDFGVYLESVDNKTDILLPRRYVPEGLEVGEFIEVFVYKDSEDRIVATTEKPFAIVGEVAFLKVKSVENIGAFMDWGLTKDLLVPFREQKVKMQEGKSYLVYIYIDERTQRIAASAKLEKFIKNENLQLVPGQETDMVVASETPVGFEVVIENENWGLLYKNEVFRKLETGDRLKGFIKKIREDNKIDVSLQRQGYDEVEVASVKLIAELEKNDGFLPLTDKSAPEEISKSLQMSKKVFKKAVGALYKQKVIALEVDGIRLLEK